MDENQLRRESVIETKKQMMLDVSDGMKTVYWKHIERKVKTWILAEEKYINSFTRLKTEDDVTDLNMAHERLAVLKQFLNINNTILKENQSFIDSMVSVSKQAFKYVKTFIKK